MRKPGAFTLVPSNHNSRASHKVSCARRGNVGKTGETRNQDETKRDETIRLQIRPKRNTRNKRLNEQQKTSDERMAGTAALDQAKPSQPCACHVSLQGRSPTRELEMVCGWEGTGRRNADVVCFPQPVSQSFFSLPIISGSNQRLRRRNFPIAYRICVERQECKLMGSSSVNFNPFVHLLLASTQMALAYPRRLRGKCLKSSKYQNTTFERDPCLSAEEQGAWASVKEPRLGRCRLQSIGIELGPSSATIVHSGYNCRRARAEVFPTPHFPSPTFTRPAKYVKPPHRVSIKSQ
ncbi:hypothetical protein B0T20DRAFT_94259 [Sordaria brevicollis]|uniref:Uncharacterized protein n=1 Tax=Sordaria brevicollis TaxID=83679 RepID=A0AAE0NX67_SORBR|nr:hypothetical protein B0T20DRAFT_94259 [Sordaria brevicollis]